MSAQKIPEWFLNDVKEIAKHKAFLKEIYPNANKYEIIEGARIAFRILSKPENLMKFPEVAKLIEALEYHSDYHCEGCQFLDADALECGCFLEKSKEALAPFKGGE